MIKVLCRRDPKRHCAAAACFPSWIWATSTVFSSGAETRHHKCKIRGNYVVIWQMKYFCYRCGIPFASKFRANTFYSAAIYILETIQRSICVFADVLAACNVPLSLSSSPSSMGDQSRYSVDQSFWSAQIIGIAEISMRWWMIDNATTVIDQWDIADKTHLQQPHICTLQVHPTFMRSMGKSNIAEQLSLFHCVYL